MVIDMTGIIILLTSVLSCFAWISHQLDGIRKAISELDKNSVSHDLCRMHRNECPCVKDMDSMKRQISEMMLSEFHGHK
jgi:hypothetical protein